MSRALVRPHRLALIAVLAAAPAAGVAVAGDAALAGPALAGMAFAAVALVDLPVGLALWLPLVFLGGLRGVDTGWHAGAVVLVVAGLGALAARRGDARWALRVHAPLCALAAVLLAWLALSLAWAEQPGLAGDVLLAWTTSVVMFLVVLAAGTRARAVRLLLGAYVGGVAFSVLFGLVMSSAQPVPDTVQMFGEGDGRLSGGIGDPNYLAASIAPAIALAIGLAAGTQGVRRAACAGVVVLLLAGLVATQSRGGFAAVVVGVLAALVVARRHGRGSLRAVAVVVCAGAAVLLASPAAWQRLTTTNDQGNGRMGLTRVALQIAADHPALGVGLANFPVHSPDYVRKPGSLEFVDLIAERGLPVHNAYLQLLVEAGPVGLLLFLAFAVACLRAAWRAGRRFEAAGRRDLAALSWAVFVAGIAALTASVFISNASDVQLWVLLAAGPALSLVAGRSARRPVAAPWRAPPARRAAAAAATPAVPAARR